MSTNKEKQWDAIHLPTRNLSTNSAHLPTFSQLSNSITPDLTADNNLINFNTKNSLVLFKAGVEPPPTPFDLKEEQVAFEKELANKVSSMKGNKGAQNITMYQKQDDSTIDLISEKG